MAASHAFPGDDDVSDELHPEYQYIVRVHTAHVDCAGLCLTLGNWEKRARGFPRCMSSIINFLCLRCPNGTYTKIAASFRAGATPGLRRPMGTNYSYDFGL